jgi:hypothetical protein
VVNRANAAEGDGEKIVELDSRGMGALKAMIVDDAGLALKKQ